jgi:hypothetical protein
MPSRPKFEVSEDVEVQIARPDGTILSARFEAGEVVPESDDEWFLLEHVLAPHGLAARVTRARKGSNA